MRIFISFLFIINFKSIGQEIKVEANFIQDSIQIGNIVSYNLNVSYPNNIEVLLPDSTYKFTSFNLDSIQFLKLPVFIINSNDSLIMYSNKDSIFLMEFIKELSDSLNLKSNTKFSFVDMAIDYPFLSKIISFLIIFIITFYLLFRKKINKYFKTKYTKKEYNTFINKIEKLNDEIQKDFKIEKIELFLLLWKRYNEKVSKYPYSSLTTSEIIHLGGNKKMNDFKKNFIMLKKHSTKIFNNKLKEINNE